MPWGMFFLSCNSKCEKIRHLQLFFAGVIMVTHNLRFSLALPWLPTTPNRRKLFKLITFEFKHVSLLHVKPNNTVITMITVWMHVYKNFTWSCGSRQRDTTSSEWKFKLNNLAVKGVMYEPAPSLPLKCSEPLIEWIENPWSISSDF